MYLNEYDLKTENYFLNLPVFGIHFDVQYKINKKGVNPEKQFTIFFSGTICQANTNVHFYYFYLQVNKA